ncbi:hypothetical protein ABID30_003261 [Enterococcus rotai]|uniref:hypothetical protein n=1 Tax=Enterococcus rotai TaxID=118060 RepID=UPI0033955235
MNQIKSNYKEVAELNPRLAALLNTLNSYVSDKSLDVFFSFRVDENNVLSLSCEIEKIVDEEDGTTENAYYVVLFDDEESLQLFSNLHRSSMISISVNSLTK